MALSILWKILVLISTNSHWRMELQFPKFANSRGAFHSIKLKFRCEFLEIFHRRMIQTIPMWKMTSRTALFAWNFSMISRFKSLNLEFSWEFPYHDFRNLGRMESAQRQPSEVHPNFQKFFTRNYRSKVEFPRQWNFHLNGSLCGFCFFFSRIFWKTFTGNFLTICLGHF